MAVPYVSEIRIFAGTFDPAGWMTCDGRLLPISENETLFQLIGTTYGGDGESTFALPDLQGRIPIHMGSGYQLAETGGVEQVALTSNQIPAHRHVMAASTDSASAAFSNANGVLANTGTSKVYALAGTPAPMKIGQILASGGSQPHNNIAPYLAIRYIISLFGIFPSQT